MGSSPVESWSRRSTARDCRAGAQCSSSDGRFVQPLLAWWEAGGSAVPGCARRASWRDLPRRAPTHFFVAPEHDSGRRPRRGGRRGRLSARRRRRRADRSCEPRLRGRGLGASPRRPAARSRRSAGSVCAATSGACSRGSAPWRGTSLRPRRRHVRRAIDAGERAPGAAGLRRDWYSACHAARNPRSPESRQDDALQHAHRLARGDGQVPGLGRHAHRRRQGARPAARHAARPLQPEEVHAGDGRVRRHPGHLEGRGGGEPRPREAEDGRRADPRRARLRRPGDRALRKAASIRCATCTPSTSSSSSRTTR